MANMCWFDMKVVGDRKNIDKFFAETKDNANWCNSINENNYSIIDGDCKWSLYSRFINSTPNLKELTEKLKLKIEVWGLICEEGLQEHYIYDNGLCLIDEEADNYKGEKLIEKWNI